jgi:hypothetical protein
MLWSVAKEAAGNWSAQDAHIRGGRVNHYRADLGILFLPDHSHGSGGHALFCETPRLDQAT